MTNNDYHRHPAISKSALDQLTKSPAHYKYWLTAPHEETKALRVGSAFHMLVLEPDKFAQEYAVMMTGIDGRTKEGKAIKTQFEIDNAGKILLAADEYEMICGMRDSINAHPVASSLLSYPGEAEKSIFWTHDLGVDCKCKPDYLRDDGLIIDLKSTEDASPAGFMRHAERYRYYVQAAHYMQGVREHTWQEPRGFVFIAVEKAPPYVVACYQATPQMIFEGDAEVGRLLTLWKECKASDSWPGYQEEIMPLDRPGWANNQ